MFFAPCWADFAWLWSRWGFIMAEFTVCIMKRSDRATEHNFNALYRAAMLRMRHGIPEYGRRQAKGVADLSGELGNTNLN